MFYHGYGNLNQTAYKVWVAALPTLSAEQGADILVRLRLLSLTALKEHSGKSDFGPRVLQSICSVMQKIGVDSPSVFVLQKSTAYVSALPKINDLAGYFEKISQSKLEQDAVLKTAIELLYFDLVNWQGIAISPYTLLKQIHRIPATLNRHFPGYVSSGLLLKVIRKSA